MARLPVYQNQGRLTSQAPGNILELDTFSGTQQNIRAMSDATAQLNNKWGEIQGESQTMNAKTNLTRESARILQQAIDYNSYSSAEELEAKQNELIGLLGTSRDNVVKTSFTDKKYANAFQQQSDLTNQVNEDKLRAIFRNKHIDLFKSGLVENEQINYDSFLMTGNQLFKDDYIQTINKGVDIGMIDRATATALTLKSDKWNNDFVLAQAKIDPDGTLTALKAGSFDIKDVDMKDMEDKIKQIKSNTYAMDERLRNQQQDQYLDDFYNNAEKVLSQGGLLTEDDIPEGLDGKNKMNLRNFIKSANNKGDVDTKMDTWQYLYEQSVNNPQQFMKQNLIQYRSNLSDSDYKSFVKQQEDMKNFKPTELQDDDKMIKNALKTYGKEVRVGFSGVGEQNNLSSALGLYIKEQENFQKKHFTKKELEAVISDFSDAMGYKDPESKKKLIQLYSDGLNKQAGFTRAVVGDFREFEQTHGRRPTNEEKFKMVSGRVSMEVQNQNREISNVLNTGDVWFGHKITSMYGKREAPTAGASTYHKGVDLDYKMNEPVQAFSSGKVINVGKDPQGYGNFVDIQGSDGAIHRYAHASKINVKQGQQIRQGDFIANAGSSGVSTGPHLHYEKIVNGQSVNPFGDRNLQVANNTVRMKAPNGSIYNVPINLVAQYERIGGVRE